MKYTVYTYVKSTHKSVKDSNTISDFRNAAIINNFAHLATVV